MCTNLTGTECKSYISGSDCEVKNGLCTVVYLFKNNSICVSQGKRYWITKTCDYFWPIFIYQRMQYLFILCDFLLFLIKNILFFFSFFCFLFHLLLIVHSSPQDWPVLWISWGKNVTYNTSCVLNWMPLVVD